MPSAFAITASSCRKSLLAIADHRGEAHQEWRFAQGENRFAALYHYKGSAFAMGSAAHYRWNEWGYQETVLHLRLGEQPEAAVWINHPGETIQFGYGRPSYWGGCGTLPRAHQYRGLAVLDFATFEEQPDFTHAWFPVAEFDDSIGQGQPRARPQRQRGGACCAAAARLGRYRRPVGKCRDAAVSAARPAGSSASAKATDLDGSRRPLRRL